MLTWLRFLKPEGLVGYLTYQPLDHARVLVARGIAEYAYPDADRRNPVLPEHFGTAAG